VSTVDAGSIVKATAAKARANPHQWQRIPGTEYRCIIRAGRGRRVVWVGPNHSPVTVAGVVDAIRGQMTLTEAKQ